MSGISTKSVKVGGGNLPKSINPGNVEAKITNIFLQRPGYAKPNEKAYYVCIDLETPPIGNGFVGFNIDKDDESKGTHLGQTGRIKTSKFDYRDSKNKAGKQFSMIDEIIKVLKAIEIEAGTTWLDDMDGKFNTIEDLVEAFAKAAPYKEVYLHWCIGADAELKEDGHYKYYMHLAKYERGFMQFANEAKKEKVIKFDEVIHVNKPKTENVAGFDGDDVYEELSADDDLLDL
jgi:hypothetical protein